VFFEPSASSDPSHLEEALNLAHIVKISSDRVRSNEAVLTATKPKIIIETLGSSGLRFRLNRNERKRGTNEWYKLPPIFVETLRDTAGAGDWCTAGIIHMLGAQGAAGLDELSFEDVRKGVHVGQAMASWTCGFDGPRGGMYQTTKRSFQKSVRDLLNGGTQPVAVVKKPTVTKRKRLAFVCESCAGDSRGR
jgi:fructokinase